MRAFIALCLGCVGALAFAVEGEKDDPHEVKVKITFPKTVQLSTDAKDASRSFGDLKIKIELSNHGKSDVKLSAVDDVQLAYGVIRDRTEGHGIARNRKNPDLSVKVGETRSFDWVAELYSPTAEIGTQYLITVGVLDQNQTARVKSVSK